ncbi:UDP-N-acetylmuramate dehydrogenase [Alteromonas flava]|uniref:UDP-N-acetylmuramate dehydrogenase n=1 Tax=Alteromonas flava TaxID=2048003 RepID=UPI000C2853F8|nr:UDP-N-acetylmuramate dehydrogenase [Alteromonas flava]
MNNLASFHTFALTAQCQQLQFIDALADIPHVRPNSDFWILGEGSNCIFVDDFVGAVWVNRLTGIDYQANTTHHNLRVASGENWHRFVEFCLGKQIYGLENLALIPGTVGAAPIQNIGAYGREVAEFISAVEVIDLTTGEAFELNKEQCQFGYRDSVFKASENAHWFITHVRFKVPKDCSMAIEYGELRQLSAPTPEAIFATVIDVRRKKLPDPTVMGNAGSFFKNPVIDLPHFERLQEQYPAIPSFKVDVDHIKVPAAWLIDQAGFKGSSRGGVQCHINQPLVLINTGNAQGQEVLSFAREIRATIQQQFGISLENEVRLIGAQGLIAL